MEKYELPPQSSEIFERLSRGLFISKNMPGSPEQDYFQLIHLHEELYKYFFSQIGFHLEKGGNYYFFSRPESKSQTEDKIERLFRYLDGIELLFLLEPRLKAGSTLQMQRLEEQLISDKQLSRKALNLSMKASSSQAIEKVKSFCKLLEKESFLSLIDEQLEFYLVLDSFHYLTDLFIKIDQES